MGVARQQEADSRIEPRVKALIRVRLRGSGTEREACILDLSSRGLLLTTGDPPKRGDYVELVSGRHSLIGHVKWAGNRRFGVTLRERIDIFAVIQGEMGAITRSARVERQAARPAAAIAFDSAMTARRIQIVVFWVAAFVAAALIGHLVGGLLSRTFLDLSATLDASSR